MQHATHIATLSYSLKSSRVRWVWVAGIGQVLGCTLTADVPSPCATGREAIVNGTAESSPLPATNNDDGIGYLQIAVSNLDREEERLCTVSRVSYGKAITAAHCFEDAEHWQASIGFDSPMASGVPACRQQSVSPLRVLEHYPNSTEDIDVVVFEDNGGPTLSIANTVPEPGSAALLVGYGLTENGTFGEKRFAQSTVTQVSPTELTVDSQGDSGACSGDSGGPLLVRSGPSSYALVGVLSAGSLSCKGQDKYTSLPPQRSWLEPWLDQPDAH